MWQGRSAPPGLEGSLTPLTMSTMMFDLHAHSRPGASSADVFTVRTGTALLLQGTLGGGTLGLSRPLTGAFILLHAVLVHQGHPELKILPG